MNLFDGIMEGLNEALAYEQSKKTWPVQDIAITPCCPHCGDSYYQELYSTTTAIAWTPIYKNGVLQNSNPNVTTTYCRCLNCGKKFDHKS
jgi:hypothetical protein